jgi:hypothetical protein
MKVDHFTRDHAIVVQAAHAYRNDQPEYAATLLREAADPMRAALDLVGLLMQERAEVGIVTDPPTHRDEQP